MAISFVLAISSFIASASRATKPADTDNRVKFRNCYSNNYIDDNARKSKLFCPARDPVGVGVHNFGTASNFSDAKSNLRLQFTVCGRRRGGPQTTNQPSEARDKQATQAKLKAKHLRAGDKRMGDAQTLTSLYQWPPCRPEKYLS
jgi:hypothetical protein